MGISCFPQKLKKKNSSHKGTKALRHKEKKKIAHTKAQRHKEKEDSRAEHRGIRNRTNSKI